MEGDRQQADEPAPEHRDEPGDLDVSEQQVGNIRGGRSERAPEDS